MKATYSVGRYGRTYYCAECNWSLSPEQWHGEYGSKAVLHHPVNDCPASDTFYTFPEFFVELTPVPQTPQMFKMQGKETFDSKHPALTALGIVAIVAIVVGCGVALIAHFVDK